MCAERTIPCSRKKLLEVGKNVAAVVLKFLEKLTAKKINQSYLDAFNADLTATGEMKTDTALEKEAAAQTVLVKAKCKDCYKWGMKIKTYLQREYGKKSPVINEFPNNFEDLKTDEAGLINTMPQVIELAKKYEIVLSSKGMDDDFVELGETLLAELDILNKEQTTMVAEHAAYRIKRHRAHLNLYDKINYITAVGREVFENDPVNKKYFESPWTLKGNGKEEGEVAALPVEEKK